MRVRGVVVLLALLVLVNSTLAAINTRDIDDVRDKPVLESQDLEIIDKFVADAVTELIRTQDFTAVAKIRTIILQRKSSNKAGAEGQYGPAFFKAAHAHIADAFEQAGKLRNEQDYFRIELNFMILIDSLSDSRLLDFATKRLNHPNAAVRYWAVHAVTNPAVVGQMTNSSPAELALLANITGQLEKIVPEAQPQTLALMARFAQISQGRQLLLDIVDTRLKKYDDWSVKNELLEVTLLGILFERLVQPGQNEAEFARRFAQLCSYAFQRYIRGKDILSEESKQQLASVLAEMESSWLPHLLGPRPLTIRVALEQNDYDSLLSQHNELFGSGSGPGLLPSKLNFDYGQTEDGTSRTAPLQLPQPVAAGTPE